MKVLGISAYYHDSAAALVTDGRVVAAAQQERYSRRKHDAGFPAEAIRFCLESAGASLDDIDRVVFYEKPFLKFERLLETYLAVAPRGLVSFATAMPQWLREKLFQREHLGRELRAFGQRRDWARRLLFAEHHLSHAASAFFPSPFVEAAILTMDGVGEWATAALGRGSGNHLELLREIHFPHSLGLFYSAFTSYCGFRVNSGEYKLMGLAAFGEPRFAGLIRERLIDIKPDGSFRLNLDYFGYCTGLRMTNAKFHALFGGAPRAPGEEITQRHKDVAASAQAVLEEVVVRMARTAARQTGARNLCLAGGVALNCVAMGRLLGEGIFERLWIQPASGDAGGALGAALLAGADNGNRALLEDDAMGGVFLGPGFDQSEIERRLRESGARFSVLEEAELIRRSAESIAAGRVLGWFQGRMEFGPRGLGARSILADPRRAETKDRLNREVKHRESFRPFAPAVLAEHAGEWFDLPVPSPYMLLAARVTRPEIPAVTHVDGTARVQTVDGSRNPLFARLLAAFHALTGCPVVLNTSFNVRGEPLVCTPGQAFRCFMGAGMDVLAIGRCFLEKDEQDPALTTDYWRGLAD